MAWDLSSLVFFLAQELTSPCMGNFSGQGGLHSETGKQKKLCRPPGWNLLELRIIKFCGVGAILCVSFGMRGGGHTPQVCPQCLVLGGQSQPRSEVTPSREGSAVWC